MSEHRWLTKRERREHARAQWRARRTALAKRRRQRQVVTVMIAVGGIAAIAALVAARTRRPRPENNVTLRQADIPQAFSDA